MKKFIKLIIISLIVFAIILTAIAALLPNTIRVSRATDIQAAPDKVKSLVTNFQNWELWLYKDSAANVQVKTNQLIIGDNTILPVRITDSTVTTSWQNKKGNQQLSTITLISNNQQTTVQWLFEQKFTWYSWGKIAAIANDKMMGPTMEKSLGNLKKVAEEIPAQ